MALFGRPVHADSLTLSVTDVADVSSFTEQVVDTGHGAAPGPAAIPLFSPGNCTVTSTLDSGAGSLRACMAQLGAGDVIIFNTTIFPPGSPQTITLSSALPDIVTNNVTINGSNAGVVLNGSGTPDGTGGLVIDGVDNVVIKGLQILNFPGDGIWLGNGASHNTIGGTNATPGGSCSGDCNLISGNGLQGVAIAGSGTTSNTVSGNYIGTDIGGTAVISNTWNGINIGGGASYNVIGGDTAGERNLISGNGSVGVNIAGSGTMSNTVSGNYIGTDASGMAVLSNENGVSIASGAQHNRIGGSTVGERNVIGGNRGNDVTIWGIGTDYNVVSSNFIGIDASGTAALRTSATYYAYGVHVHSGAQYSVIGGATPGERNVIGGTDFGIQIDGSDTAHNVVIGNFIGTNMSGTTAVGNFLGGVLFHMGAYENRVGGSAPGEGNLISGNGEGVGLQTGSHDNVVVGNLIGTDASGTTALGNQTSGVVARWDAYRNQVGGLNPGEGNLISGNGRNGVSIEGNDTINNTITQNSIYSNAGKGIELVDGGNLELFPPILTDVTADTTTGIAVPNSTVEVFSDNEDEGQVFEGSTTADGSGDFTFNQPRRLHPAQRHCHRHRQRW